MVIQLEISEQLTRAINDNYEKANYTGVILDAVFLLSDTLRDRTGCQSDGVSLIGEALGGTDPKLKLSPLKNESDKNIQRGTEAILRGIVQAIRNPRSHKKTQDVKLTADQIIIFVDYLLEIIDKAKSPFDVSDLLHRICDQYYVEDENYSALLVEEIPKEKLSEVLTAVYDSRKTIKPEVMKLITHAILEQLSNEDKAAFAEIVSNDLKFTKDSAIITTATTIFAGEDWNQITRVARLRIENRLLESISKGKYDSGTMTCQDGALGTWLSNIIDTMELREQALYTLSKKLSSSNRNEQDYVFKYFGTHLIKFEEKPNDYLLESFRDGLISGDKRYYDLLHIEILFSNEEWASELHPLIESFEEKTCSKEELVAIAGAVQPELDP